MTYQELSSNYESVKFYYLEALRCIREGHPEKSVAYIAAAVRVTKAVEKQLTEAWLNSKGDSGSC